MPKIGLIEKMKKVDLIPGFSEILKIYQTEKDYFEYLQTIKFIYPNSFKLIASCRSSKGHYVDSDFKRVRLKFN